MTTISGGTPHEYVNRFEMKAGLYRILRDYNGGLPIPAERSTACIKDKVTLHVPLPVNLALPSRLSFFSIARGKSRRSIGASRASRRSIFS